MKHRTLTSLFAAATLAVSLTAAAPASAATIQLGFILDSSGSITASGWSTIVTGLSNAILNDIPLPGADTYEVSVVSFSSTTQTVLNHVLINSAAARSSAAASVLAATFLNANTNYAIGFSAMQTALTSSPNFSAGGTSYVNFATDGAPNEPTDFATALAAGIVARNNLINAGIDNISIEGIGINAAGRRSWRTISAIRRPATTPSRSTSRRRGSTSPWPIRRVTRTPSATRSEWSRTRGSRADVNGPARQRLARRRSSSATQVVAPNARPCRRGLARVGIFSYSTTREPRTPRNLEEPRGTPRNPSS